MKKWLSHIEPTILSMAGLRLLSGLIEFSAAIVMLLLNDVKKALAINAILATIGPVIFLLTMTLGLIYMADELSFQKLFFIASGVGLILIGLYR
ncbi:hypothetical protein CIB95_04500 [Lottiidibacillus patelloidae]|uniref:DUF2619 domain-containing protein n=1 Tax=Lottiidibacillus patelloidae TaxID=2670334 RepID=A0A263BWD5_9BACI|nr:YqhV family protein [Lottiidibacillus patelloidae]OZM57637.1 hypothetical protein CIB95_04500 [Lottiidibacillus patelloidae]